jgi:hypothetical protein
MKRFVYSLLILGSASAATSHADITTDEKVLTQIENTEDFDEPELLKIETETSEIDDEAVEER